MLLLAALLQVTIVRGAEQSDLIGEWVTTKKDAIIKIYEEDGRYFGKIIWLKDRPEGKAENLKDVFNPDPELRDRPLQGLVILKHFKEKKPGLWDDGTIYDPESGKEYKCILQLKDRDTLKVKGYIGIPLFSRTEIWTRNKPQE